MTAKRAGEVRASARNLRPGADEPGEKGTGMSHFYGVLSGSRGEATRCGTKKSGLRVTAASWSGCIRVSIAHNEETGEDGFLVVQDRWQGKGFEQVIASGTVGEPTPKENVNAALVEAAKDIIDSWDAGDLAGAVRKLVAAVKKAEGVTP